MADSQRPRVRIRFRYNLDTGAVEEFLIDDNAPERSETYHDRVAEVIARCLAQQPVVADAGPIRHQPGLLEPPRPCREPGKREDDPQSMKG